MRSLAFLHKDGDTAPPGRGPDDGGVSSIYFYHTQCTRTATKNTVFGENNKKNQEKNKIHLCKMNFSTLRAVFFEKRIPQNLAFVKTWQDMEIAKSPAAKPQNRQKAPQLQQGTGRKKLQKHSAPLVERRKICYTIFHDAPSPSGKAGDFDSPIVGSTPAGATRRGPLYRRLRSGLFCILLRGVGKTGFAQRFYRDLIASAGRSYYNNRCFLGLKQQRMQRT